MARPQKYRRICREPEFDSFFPGGTPTSQSITLSLDEYEVIRLVDFGNKTHAECAEYMEISRPTVTEIYENARKKLADFIVNGKTLQIQGGVYRLCEGALPDCRHKECKPGIMQEDLAIYQHPTRTASLRFVIPFKNGLVQSPFGCADQLKISDVAERKLLTEAVVNIQNNGISMLVSFLQSIHTDVLICDGIGGKARSLIQDMGIRVYSGMSGDAGKVLLQVLQKL